MCIAREHDDGLNLVTRDFIVENFSIGVGFVAERDETVTADNSKIFKLAVMPMLSLGDSWLRYVDANLTAFERMNQFGE